MIDRWSDLLCICVVCRAFAVDLSASSVLSSSWGWAIIGTEKKVRQKRLNKVVQVLVR